MGTSGNKTAATTDSGKTGRNYSTGLSSEATRARLVVNNEERIGKTCSRTSRWRDRGISGRMTSLFSLEHI